MPDTPHGNNHGRSPGRQPDGARGPRLGAMLVLSVVLVGSLLYLLVLALEGAKLVRVALPRVGTTVAIHDARPWLIAALAAGVLILLAWALTERQLGSLRLARVAERRARAAEEEARAAEQAALGRLRRSETQRERLQRERSEDRAQREGMAQAWRGEREWNRELRGQIERLQRAQGVLGRHDDVRTTVLELTMSLVDAEKGLLLSRRETADDQREVVCFSGFDNDPSDSALAQRFADEVIERDTTIREDDRSRVDAEKRSAADEEVRNLLAIPIYMADNFSGVIVCANRDGGFEALDDDVLLAVGDHAGAVLQNSRLHGDVRSAYLATIQLLADAIELKDPDLRRRSDHVSEYVVAVADRLDLEPRAREQLIFASLLRDVGKLGISERILLKPADLTAEERSVIQLHPRIGYQLVRQIPALQEIVPAVLHHHERFDGDGYPGRLRGETIPLAARIIAVADAFSAIISDRPYSTARSVEEACAELERCAGGQFDPEVVSIFVEEVRRRPPTESDGTVAPPDAELEVHRLDGELRLGARSFAITDSLTLLYSHRHFHETARAEAQRASLQDRPFAVIIAELVGIGDLNRSRGFAAGDEALQAVGAVFHRAAARCSGQAFRASGRRIALLGPDLDHTAADLLLDDLRREIETVFEEDRIEFTLGAYAWRAGDDGEQVIDHALLAAAKSRSS